MTVASTRESCYGSSKYLSFFQVYFEMRKCPKIIKCFSSVKIYVLSDICFLIKEFLDILEDLQKLFFHVLSNTEHAHCFY